MSTQWFTTVELPRKFAIESDYIWFLIKHDWQPNIWETSARFSAWRRAHSGGRAPCRITGLEITQGMAQRIRFTDLATIKLKQNARFLSMFKFGLFLLAKKNRRPLFTWDAQRIGGDILCHLVAKAPDCPGRARIRTWGDHRNDQWT